NGGTCTDGSNSYTCACAAGYTGTECGTGETSLSHLITVEHPILFQTSTTVCQTPARMEERVPMD
ncbi:MAG: calcium-binding EGF-like domain-containing protein, partial [Gammaproteobacteria bacterium]|nr:calcium-binding EGF-like domain-containing protein [Gammaproteobacteria bacterium]